MTSACKPYQIVTSCSESVSLFRCKSLRGNLAKYTEQNCQIQVLTLTANLTAMPLPTFIKFFFLNSLVCITQALENFN